MGKLGGQLNPKSHAVKQLEMTVRRALETIEAFDKLDKGQDWTEVPNATYRKIFGTDHYTRQRMIEEVHKRYKSGRLFTEVLDLYNVLPEATQKRKELKSGIAKLRKRQAS